MLNITILPILEDNYAYILESDSIIAVVDPGAADPIINFLEDNNLTPSFILNTHHHWDHTNGNKKIKEKYRCRLIGPKSESSKINDLDIGLSHGSPFKLGNETFKTIEVSGHTSGHICFYAQQSKILFSGDALFSLGSGRLFEGNATDMFNGFQHLKQLPDETLIYCGHEYTQENAKFCIAQNPDNLSLIKRVDEITYLRKRGEPTIPTTLKQEKETNVFLRAKTAEELKKLRELKDNF